jgi:hypothetical protein
MEKNVINVTTDLLNYSDDVANKLGDNKEDEIWDSV